MVWIIFINTQQTNILCDKPACCSITSVCSIERAIIMHSFVFFNLCREKGYLIAYDGMDNFH